MTDMLNTALSALQSYQQALTTTSSNIANANTVGYSRQRVDLASRAPQQSPVGSIGTGVSVSGISRYADQAVTDQLRNTTASFGHQESLYGLAAQLQSLMTDENTGIDGAVSNVFNALQGVVNDPSSLAARRVFLDDTQALATRFNTLDNQFNALDQTANTQIASAVDDINQLAGRIAELNISVANTGGKPSNDLLDQRDQALLDLNTLLKVTTSPNQDGSLNVYVGNGEPIVFGGQRNALSAAPGPLNPLQSALVLNGNDVTRSLSGGSLGGILAFREEVLAPARSELGLIGLSLASQFNSQNQAGVDLFGQAGGTLFNLPAPRVLAATPNTGTATLSLQVSDLTQVTGADYLVRFQGGQPLAYQMPDASPVPLTGSGPFMLAGLSFSLAGTPADGDTFLLQPTAAVPGGLKTVLSDPNRLAAADAAGGRGNNRNALLMAGIESRKTLGGNTLSLKDQMQSLLSDIASSTRQAEIGRQSQSILRDQAAARRDSITGVNLDEEAASLMRYQQAYQAAAQAINIANSVFQTLMTAVQR